MTHEQAMHSTDPYAAPVAEVQRVAAVPEHELASRGARFAAHLIDTVVYLVALLVPILAAAALAEADSDAQRVDESGALLVVGFVVLGLPFAAVLGVQLVMLNANGWSIGKRLLGIRIVDLRGQRVGLSRIFWMRMFLPFLAQQLCGLVSLVDALMIFARDRRCLHDHMAGTIVIRA